MDPISSAHNEPRLMITKIACENFKSYAGTQELGPFHKVGRLVNPHVSDKHVCISFKTGRIKYSLLWTAVALCFPIEASRLVASG